MTQHWCMRLSTVYKSADEKDYVKSASREKIKLMFQEILNELMEFWRCYSDDWLKYWSLPHRILLVLKFLMTHKQMMSCILSRTFLTNEPIYNLALESNICQLFQHVCVIFITANVSCKLFAKQVVETLSLNGFFQKT